MRSFKLPICALLLVAAGACDRTTQQAAAEKEEAAPQNIVYGINADNYRTETGEVGSGETLGKILNGYGPYGRQARQSLKRDFPAAQHPRRA